MEKVFNKKHTVAIAIIMMIAIFIMSASSLAAEKIYTGKLDKGIKLEFNGTAWCIYKSIDPKKELKENKLKGYLNCGDIIKINNIEGNVLETNKGYIYYGADASKYFAKVNTSKLKVGNKLEFNGTAWCIYKTEALARQTNGNIAIGYLKNKDVITIKEIKGNVLKTDKGFIYYGADASKYFTVKTTTPKKNVTVTLNKDSVCILKGKTLQLKATVKNATNKEVIWSTTDGSLATAENGKLIALKPGVVNVVATSKEDGKVSARCNVKIVELAFKNKITTVNYESRKDGNELEVKLGDKEYLNKDFGNADGLKIEWSITKDDAKVIKSIDKNGTVKINNNGKLGTAIIKATLKDGNKDTGISASCRLTVVSSSSILNEEKISIEMKTGPVLEDGKIKVGGFVNLQAEVVITPKESKANKASNRRITWTSNNEKVAKVNQSGKVTGISAGTATITATARIATTKDATQEMKDNGSVTFTITVKAPTIKGLPKSMDIKGGEDLSKYVTIEPSTLKTISWKSSDKNIVKIDKNGKITLGKNAKNDDTAIITATPEKGGKPAECKVTVIIEEAKVEGVKVTGEKKKLLPGEEIQLSAKVTFDKDVTSDKANQEVIWKSKNEKVAIVDENGRVTVKKDVKAGDTAVIVAKSKLDNKKYGTWTIKVITKIELNNGAITLDEGKTFQLKATVLPEQNVTFSTSNKSAATVSKTGLVTAKKAGTAVITAKAADGTKATCKVTVTKTETEKPVTPTKPTEPEPTTPKQDKYELIVTYNGKEIKDNNKINIKVGEKINIGANLYCNGNKVKGATYKCGDLSKAKIDVVQNKKIFTITAKQTGEAFVKIGATYNGHQYLERKISFNIAKANSAELIDGGVNAPSSKYIVKVGNKSYTTNANYPITDNGGTMTVQFKADPVGNYKPNYFAYEGGTQNAAQHVRMNNGILIIDNRIGKIDVYVKWQYYNKADRKLKTAKTIKITVQINKNNKYTYLKYDTKVYLKNLGGHFMSKLDQDGIEVLDQHQSFKANKVGIVHAYLHSSWDWWNTPVGKSDRKRIRSVEFRSYYGSLDDVNINSYRLDWKSCKLEET